MKFSKIMLLTTCLAMTCVRAESSPFQSELDKNIEAVESYLSMSEARLTRLLRGITGIEVNIYFRTNSVEIDRSNRERIYNIAKVMRIYPMVYITLSGHTDSRGSQGYNMDLSQRRIDAVMQVFRDALSNNYNSKRFNSNAYGEKIAPHDPADIEGMFYDRRVSILLLVQSSHPY